MTTFQICSDLHIEFLNDPTAFLDSFDPTGVDCLLLAGDICSYPLLDQVAGKLSSLYPRVLMVNGNHDYFHHRPEEVHRNCIEIQQRYTNFSCLIDEVAEVNGVRIAGCTLWYPEATEFYTKHNRKAMPEFSVVKGFEPWVYEQHNRDQKFLWREAYNADIVMTHHMPHPESIHQRFKGNGLNHYFMVDMSELIEEAKPKVWVHGHTHNKFDYKVGSTRVICNPKGYPNERYNDVWDSKLTIEL